MLLQNLTLLTNDTVVQVINIAPPSRPQPQRAPVFADATPAAPTPSIVSPLLPRGGATVAADTPASPAHEAQIIVSTSAPGRIGSSTVYSGEASVNGLESARRAAQAAADRARLETSAVAGPDAIAAYAEAGSLSES